MASYEFFPASLSDRGQVSRTDYPDHGVKRMMVQWARGGSSFMLLFEQLL